MVLKDKIWIWKMENLLRWMTFKNRIRRWLYCRRGYHDISSGYMETTNHDKEVIRSDFVRCCTCETCFFPTEQDKKNYLRQKEQERTMWNNLAESMKKNFNIQMEVKPKGKLKVKEFK